MKNRVLSIHQEHELLLKLEQAGLSETDAQAIIESKGNALARQLIGVIRGEKVEGNFFLFTTSGLTLNKFVARNLDLFRQGLFPWWENQPFANKRSKVRKLLLRTSAQPDSFSKTWFEQTQLLASGEFVPTVADVVEGMIAYHRSTGEWFFSGCWVRTNDVTSYGPRVYVGFLSGGVYIYTFGATLRDADIGLSVARKPA